MTTLAANTPRTYEGGPVRIEEAAIPVIAADIIYEGAAVGIVPASVMSNEINYSSWFFVAGVIGVGAIANHTGLGTTFGTLLLDTIPLTPDGGLITFYELFAIGGAVSIVTTAPAAPAPQPTAAPAPTHTATAATTTTRLAPTAASPPSSPCATTGS